MSNKPYTIILAPNASIMTGPGTNTIILGGGVEGATVIDPAEDNAEYLETLIRVGSEHGDIRRILITHGHPDHMGGAVTLRRLLGISIYAFSREGVADVDQELVDGMSIPAGEDTLRVIHTPGHRFDHLCFLLEKQRTLFAGDLIAGTGTVVIIPPEGNMIQYLSSLKRLQSLDIAEIVPAHGPTINNPQAKFVEYIEHRLLREQQILQVLQMEQGNHTIPKIVQRIYTQVDPQLHALAALSVEAHLLKLKHEKKVCQTGRDGWALQS